MREFLKLRIVLVFLFTGMMPGFLIAQQPTLQDLFFVDKNIFLLVSADQLWQASIGGQPVNVENFCALQDNAGVMKYGAQTKEKDSAIEVLQGDYITWSGKVDPFSRNEYDISILQIVVKEVIGENIFETVYLPGTNKKVYAKVRDSLKIPSEARYNILFSLSKKKSDSTQFFTLDPWILVRR